MASESQTPESNSRARQFGRWTVSDVALWSTVTVTGLYDGERDAERIIYLPVWIFKGEDQTDEPSVLPLHAVFENTADKMDQSHPDAGVQHHTISSQALALEGIVMEEIPSLSPGNNQRRQWKDGDVIVLSAVDDGG